MKENKKTQEKQPEKSKEDEYREMLQRLQAEFQNYQKRTEREQTDFKQYANTDLIKELLVIMDDFDLAIKNKDQEGFREGIELLYAKFAALLKKEGLQKIDAEGQFNPELHEALLQEASEKEQGTIIEELQAGYKLHDRIIRPSKVKVSMGGKQNE